MAGLSGGGSRARKKLRRQPSTRGALKKARRRFCKEKRGWKCDLERHSYLQGDQTKFARTPILRDAIFPAGNGCTYFVMKYPANLSRERYKSEPTPYEVASLCEGGRKVTGMHRYATKAQAKAAAKYRAEMYAKKRDRGY